MNNGIHLSKFVFYIHALNILMKREKVIFLLCISLEIYFLLQRVCDDKLFRLLSHCYIIDWRIALLNFAKFC